ncbi:hypothetical protein HDV01_007693 [Terramyces sp. JEL0728]|nr:hypothetical protein HDV01_007693 [Terramyces sp. JEL0728]
MANYTKDILIQKLDKLSATQESIQITSMWIQFHSQRKESVDTWVEQISKLVGEKRLYLLYLCNDLKKEFIPLFKQVLPSVFKDCLKHTKKETKQKISRILNVWKERNIYSQSFIDELSNLLNDQEDELVSITNGMNTLKALMVTKQKHQSKDDKDQLLQILQSELKARQKIRNDLQKLLEKQDELIQQTEKQVEELTVKNVHPATLSRINLNNVYL